MSSEPSHEVKLMHAFMAKDPCLKNYTGSKKKTVSVVTAVMYLYNLSFDFHTSSHYSNLISACFKIMQDDIKAIHV